MTDFGLLADGCIAVSAVLHRVDRQADNICSLERVSGRKCCWKAAWSKEISRNAPLTTIRSDKIPAPVLTRLNCLPFNIDYLAK
jgi:hypothetical protein